MLILIISHLLFKLVCIILKSGLDERTLCLDRKLELWNCARARAVWASCQVLIYAIKAEEK